MYLFLYNISLRLFRIGVRPASLFNTKARLWLDGRKDIFQKLRKAFPGHEKTIWFHCASLGEFEQGRPVIEQLKKNYPTYKILLTFFSPSGYEIRKDYPVADWVFYLPMDSAANAQNFLEIVDPSLVVFVKYEFWYYYFEAINSRKIPFFLLSALFRPEQVFFKWYGGLYRQMLRFFTHIFVQDASSLDLLSRIGLITNISVAGDTRFDRVVEIAMNFEPIPLIQSITATRKVIVAGSTWPDDEKRLGDAFYSMNDPSVQLIIAPHEISPSHIEQLKTIFPGAILFSSLAAGNTPVNLEGSLASPIIVDSIGLLARLYYYARVTYIGGGFTRDGIHNALEAAVYGKPVVFGPNFKKYREAVELVDAGGATSFSSGTDLKKILIDLLNDEEVYSLKAQSSRNYVIKEAGATDRVCNFIQENRLLTN